MLINSLLDHYLFSVLQVDTLTDVGIVWNDAALQTVEQNLDLIRTAAEKLAGRPVPVKARAAEGVGGDRFAAVNDLFSQFGFKEEK